MAWPLESSMRGEMEVPHPPCQVERTPFCPHELVYCVFSDLASRAREQGVSLEFDAACPLPETVFSDRARLNQVLTNLVSNAIRFTARGRVRVVARMASIQGRSLVSIDVIDDGAGIPSEAYEAIFVRSVGDVRDETHCIGANCIGLPCSRRFARLLGGDLIVRSARGEGCTFTVRFDPGPLDGVRRIPPCKIQPHSKTVAIRLLVRLEGEEASLLAGDHDTITGLAHWLKDAADTVGSAALHKPADALFLLPRDAKEHEIAALIGELRNLAEQIAIDR